MHLLVPIASLGQNGSDTGARCVHLHNELKLGIRMNENRGRGKQFFETAESRISLRSPHEGKVCGGESSKGSRYFAIIPDKPTVKIGKP